MLYIFNKQLCCRKEAARFSSQLQQYKTSCSLLLLVTQATDLSLRAVNALFCCLWRKVEVSCHKHFVVVSRYQHRRLLPVIQWRRVDNTWPVAALTGGSEARYRLRIAISAYLTCIRRRRQGVPSEWCGYPMVKKIGRYVNSFRQNVRT